DGDKKAAGNPNPEIVGTTFILEDPNGLKQEVVSGELGIIEFPGVKKGVTYKLYEKQTDFAAPYINNTGVVLVRIGEDGIPSFVPDKFPLIDPDNNPETDNSGYEFLNYLQPKPEKKIKVVEGVTTQLLDNYDLKEHHEIVTYQISVPVKGIGDINVLEIIDTVDQSMQVIPNSAKVYADGVDISEYFQRNTSNLSRTQSYKIERVSGNMGQIENKTLTFEFQAKIILGPSSFAAMHPDLTVPNKAVMTVNNMPENRLETNTVNIKTQLTDLSLTKKLEIQGNDPINLPTGVTASFELTKPEDELFAPRKYTGGSDTLTIPNLDVGKYILTETKAPEGYLPIEPIYFEVKNVDGALKVYKTNSEWGEPVLIENNNLGDIVDPLPALPTINKMVKKKDVPMTAEGGDYKHYDMATWKDQVDFVVDIKIPENVTGYHSLSFGDELPLGLDIIEPYTANMQVGTVQGTDFTAEADQSPYEAFAPTITQTTATKQYVVEAQTIDAELISKLAGKTIRISFPAAISDKFDSISQLTLNGGNFKNTAILKVNYEIEVESSATVKPIEQFGLVLRKIADFKNNGADVPLYEAVFYLSQYIVFDGEGNPIPSESGPELPKGMDANLETGNDGYIRIDTRLEPGKYILTEGVLPGGYFLNNERHPAGFAAVADTYILEVGVDIGGGVKGVRVTELENPDFPIYEGPMPTEEEPAKIINRQTVFVPVNKVWVDDNNEQNLRPETIKLLIQRSIVVGEPDVIDLTTGKLVPKAGDVPDTPDDTFNDNAKNDITGRLNVTVNIGHLPNYFIHESLFRYSPEGTMYNYYVLETPPEGYTATYKTVTTNPGFGEYATAESVEITNTLRKTSGFTLLKQDDSDPVEVVAGAEFNLSFTDQFGRNIVVTKTSDLEGKIDLSGIVANTTYTLKEIKAPAGYQIDPTEYTIIVDADG
ncbi:MAG: isopeptide-forming domain-containing fimbrial protein, partial [Tissierellia bacterium]|nr:isopeptide-forming domain-containing fimbrial protein [Tissierellia bacterium]